MGEHMTIEEKIITAQHTLGISRMPTSGELRNNGMGGLSTAITRNGGFKKIAKDMGLAQKYDLLVNSEIKIDVKASTAYETRGYKCNAFGIHKENPTCDIYILYALDFTGEIIERIFVIPSKFMHCKSNITIGEYSEKYDKYINRWDFLEQYDKFYKSISV